MNKRILSVIVLGRTAFGAGAGRQGRDKPCHARPDSTELSRYAFRQGVAQCHRQQRHPQAGAKPGEYAGYGYSFFYQGGF